MTIKVGSENFSFEINTDDLDRFVVRFNERAIDRVLELTSFALQGELKKEAPSRSGRMRNSIQPPRRISGKAWGINFGVIWWRFVQFGTKAHIIRPKRASVLRFEKDGNIIFAQFVKHPGTKANKFVDRAIDRVFDYVPTIVQQSIKEQGTL